MLGSTAVDVVVGLVAIYVIFSVAVSRLAEHVSSRLQLRFTALTRGIRGLLEGDADAPSPAAAGTRLTAEHVLRHPTVAALSGGLAPGRKASSLPASTFAAAVLDLLAPPAEAQLDSIDRAELPASAQPKFDAVAALLTLAAVDELLLEVPPENSQHAAVVDLQELLALEPLQRARVTLIGLPASHPAKRPLLGMLVDARGDWDRFHQALERWYDAAMTRMRRWYARRVSIFLLIFGAALAIAFNVDTINISQVLWRVPSERAAVAAAAGNAGGKTATEVAAGVREVAALNLPLGWTAPYADGEQPGTKTVSSDPRRVPSTAGAIVLKAFGLILSTIALSFGATFWFGVLEFQPSKVLTRLRPEADD